MRIGVVTDSTCDLPAQFYSDHQVGILPVEIRLGDERWIDDRNPEQTLAFYQEWLNDKGTDADSVPQSAEQIRERFLAGTVLDYDYVFCITITASRSPIFQNATKASFAILSDYKSVRLAAGIQDSFALRVVDSRNLFCGTGVLVAEAARLVKAKTGPNEIRRRLDELRDHICGYMVPGDLYYIRNRAIKKGEKSVGLLTYAIGNALDIKPVILCYRGETQAVAKVRSYERAVERMFDHVTAQIERGIDSRHVCISYGGDPANVADLPGYARLAETAQQRGVELLVGIMSATAAVNTGAGCVAIAYGGELQGFGT